MKKFGRLFLGGLAAMLLGIFLCGSTSSNAYEDTIAPGISISGIDLSGMTVEEAKAAVEAYIEEVKSAEVTLVAVGGNEVTVSIAAFDPVWSNEEVITEMIELIAEGNVVDRYKARKDIEQHGVNYEVQVSCNSAAVSAVLEEQCSIYDEEVANATLSRENGEFVITDGTTGEAVDIEAATADLCTNILSYYESGNTTITLATTIVNPEGTREELEMVTDILGTYTTSFSTSGANRSANVVNGCNLINGVTLYPGEEFSTYEMVCPFTEENGYYPAGSYMNGQVVDSLGGGICQVSSTLYNAVLLAELEVTERHNHSMIVTYVPKSADAAIAESSGKDFRFVNNTDYPIYIEGYTENKTITFNIYGVETRPENRTVEYVSEVLSQTVPDHEVIIADAGQGIGYVSVQSAHIGYRARLWKVVYEDGVEVSREEVNNSTYAASPRTAVVGVNTTNPDYYNQMAAAIATGNIDHCRNVAAMLVAQSQAPAPDAAGPQ